MVEALPCTDQKREWESKRHSRPLRNALEVLNQLSWCTHTHSQVCLCMKRVTILHGCNQQSTEHSSVKVRNAVMVQYYQDEFNR